MNNKKSNILCEEDFQKLEKLTKLNKINKDKDKEKFVNFKQNYALFEHLLLYKLPILNSTLKSLLNTYHKSIYSLFSTYV